MVMNGLLSKIKVNGAKVRKNLVLSTGRSLSQEWVWPILNKVGEKRLRWCIENNQSLVERLRTTFPPQDLDNLRKQAITYKWAIDCVSDPEIVYFLPDWIATCARTYGPKGETWLCGEAARLRKFFVG